MERPIKCDWEMLNLVIKYPMDKETKLEKIKSIKQRIRKRNKLEDEGLADTKENWQPMYPNDGYVDTIYVKYKLPYLMNDEEKNDYREAEWCHWYNPYNDGRDCTGVWFTSRIRLIDCGSETIVIHVKNRDV